MMIRRNSTHHIKIQLTYAFQILIASDTPQKGRAKGSRRFVPTQHPFFMRHGTRPTTEPHFRAFLSTENAVGWVRTSRRYACNDLFFSFSGTESAQHRVSSSCHFRSSCAYHRASLSACPATSTAPAFGSDRRSTEAGDRIVARSLGRRRTSGNRAPNADAKERA